MKKIELAISAAQRRHPRWMHLMLAVMIVLGLGMAQSVTAQEINPKKPILTKSGKRAALKEAAEAVTRRTNGIWPLGPTGPTDESKVPHYFGPFPNWANSPFTLPDISVEIVGDGTGAAAMAKVGAGGAVTGITVTNPGSGYNSATVSITGAGTGATADAVVSLTGSVTAITVENGGGGYTTPQITISGGGLGGGTPSVPATATVYGGVDAVEITNFGTSGYQFPTVDFDLPDGPDGVKATAHVVVDDQDGSILEIVVDSPGSGYSFAPSVVIRDGTLFDPIRDGGSGAEAQATLTVQTVELDTLGDGYISEPDVVISDSTGIGSGATAIAQINAGAVTAINLTNPGSGYLTVGMKKFQDGLPQLCDPSVPGNCIPNGLGQYLPIAVPDTETFPGSDYYVIALVQVREQLHSDLPPTLLREYVQLETPANASWSKGVRLTTDLVDGSSVPTRLPGVGRAIAVDDPHFLGPVILAQKNRPVRIVFYNLLPKGTGGDLFMPKDSTIMGSGFGPNNPEVAWALEDLSSVMDEVRNPPCTDFPSDIRCFQDNRATLHLHGGITPWISDGTPHQWITPANENTDYPQGASVGDVPDMTGVPGVPDCSRKRDGCQTYYYTNQQSARLMFYHDHAWGITRLGVYAGEAAGYLISDDTEQKLIADGTIPADQIPLIIQDRTFVPGDAQLTEQDPTWDSIRWGGKGNFWYHHVYMPAQNPGDPTGMSPFGRWMYGPWFWPPATPPHGPIPNPYYDPACNLNDPATWQYGTDPFCEPELIPGTPNIAAGMEQFNDTPIVNGTAYPTTTVEPKAYRLRILNAANDRFWNLQWYVADPASVTDPAIGPTEVALNPAELAAAQIDPNVFPTPDTSVSPAGPDWIVIGSEGGFLPAPVVVPNQPITWITDPTVFNVGNVDQHSLLLGSAERFDVIVDFSQYAGKTLILYNDAPAAFPARVASYDYYTGAPDLYPVGAPTILPGYGPNTRTIMQVKVAATAPAPAFNLTALKAAFRHKADGSGVFESGQHPIIVGQEGYDSAYGTNFAAGGYCNGGSTSTSCDGYLRIADQGGTLFGFNTLLAPDAKLEIPIEPKAIHDEMNASAFDEFGRMQANIGLEVVPATPAAQNIVLYPFVNPQTELFDGTNLPKNDIDLEITPIANADGTQIWKITHNGVDTHPLHWHLYDVQVLNRVTWDNIVSPPHPTELGWKDTLRVSPLEDTIVALRPIIPQLPFELPNSVRPLHPMIPIGATMGFNNVDADGNPTVPIVNALVNFGTEYVWHCHILSHEEMDMMRPVSVALPPNTPDGLAYAIIDGKLELTWNDNSLNETSFLMQQSKDGGITWNTVRTVQSPLDRLNTYRTLTRTIGYNPIYAYQYRIVALNDVGYGGEFMSMSVQSTSAILETPPPAPTNLVATVLGSLADGPRIRLVFRDNALGETGFVIERSTDGGVTFSQIATLPARDNRGNVRYFDNAVLAGQTYDYRVFAVNGSTPSDYSNTATANVPAAPAAPSEFTGTAAVAGGGGTLARIDLSWTDNSTNESRFVIQRAEDAAFSTGLATFNRTADTTATTQWNLPRGVSYYYRIAAQNPFGYSAWVNLNPFPIVTP